MACYGSHTMIALHTIAHHSLLWRAILHHDMLWFSCHGRTSRGGARCALVVHPTRRIRIPGTGPGVPGATSARYPAFHPAGYPAPNPQGTRHTRDRGEVFVWPTWSCPAQATGAMPVLIMMMDHAVRPPAPLVIVKKCDEARGRH